MPATIDVSAHVVTPETAVQPATGVPVESAVPDVVERFTVYVITGVPPDANQLNKHVVPVEPALVKLSGNVGTLGVVAVNSADAVTLELDEFAVVIK